MIAGDNGLLLFRAFLQSPIGRISIVFDEQTRLRAIDWDEFEARLIALLDRQYATAGQRYVLQSQPAPASISDALGAYFEGDTAAIETLAVQTSGTEFQQSVWQALRAIPCGQTCSYAELATRIGRPLAVRAVGLANGSNPVGIVVPCPG